MCFKRFRRARTASGRPGYVIGERGRDVIVVIVADLAIFAIIFASKSLVLILQRLRANDLILTRIIILTRIKIRDCKLSTIAHTEKRLIIDRVLYLAAIKLKGDIAIALLEKNLVVADNVLRQLEAGRLTL